MENDIVKIDQGTGKVEVQHERTVAQIVDRVNLVHKVLEKVMKKGTHYGTVPGCGDKMVLFKAGAEALAVTFRLVPQFQITKTDLGNGHREYDVTCSIYAVSGELLGHGVGSASTMEKKYRYRNSNGKKIENEDIADVYNTVLKVAKKRGYIDGVLTVTAAGDLFTQDLIEEEIEEQKVTATVQDAPSSPISEQPAPKPQATYDTPKDMSEMPEGVLTTTGTIGLQGVRGKSYWVKIGNDIYSAFASEHKITGRLEEAKEQGLEVTVWYKEKTIGGKKYKNIVDVDISGGGQSQEENANTEKAEEELPF